MGVGTMADVIGLSTKPKTEPKGGKDDGFLKPDAGAKVNGLHPEVAKVLAAVHQTIKTTGRGTGNGPTDDNSNTQFGIIGLWVAARNGVPAKDAFALIEARFFEQAFGNFAQFEREHIIQGAVDAHRAEKADAWNEHNSISQ